MYIKIYTYIYEYYHVYIHRQGEREMYEYADMIRCRALSSPISVGKSLRPIHPRKTSDSSEAHCPSPLGNSMRDVHILKSRDAPCLVAMFN